MMSTYDIIGMKPYMISWIQNYDIIVPTFEIIYI